MKRRIASPISATPRPSFKGGVLYVEGAAELLNTTQKAIRGRTASNRLPFHRLDGRVIFFRDELERYLDNLPGVTVDEALANSTRARGTVR